MRELLIATHNTGKISEFEAGLKDTPFTLRTMRDTDIDPDFRVEEVGQTFEGNALIKALVCGKKSGMLAIADDSGLEIDALDGEPGVRSARYAPGTDKDRCGHVLAKMRGVPDEGRGAQFRCVLALYEPGREKIRIAEGVCRGRITHEARGEKGFGYDPIFLCDDLGITAAEASLEQKNSISHRGRALAKAREILLAEFA
ncbi:non-canonical purine NTP pyrophosphatase, RdgB/HAM1 family [Candidatus Kaiserbacteria bacterium CG10_big_fil_rev_8_21_14_0_10_59_10]|uniref:dITP/XTP pyrophosphatase n=1 Tax=Candidatus Kaiserbacteria bacterium CG10_big_fil_rev_8_21_14_0_10_59_10 TaxID=1974612 RepID=A0A2H0U784_9BACT|nr:MAG: non-canonical purine NTP pyrophosphatase, RdgB/HAM1 family [Candidatus Kaiserbacteria bacterium CG10_big_fil_rev_8_21_14_0_10_59_10]